MDNVPKLIQKFRANVEKTALKLTKSLPIADFPEGIVKEALVFGYASDQITEKAIAVVINAAVASGKTEFLLSRKLLKDCFNQDVNLTEQKDFNGATQKKIMGTLVGCGLLERITDASTKPGFNRRAATYRVIDPDVLSLILAPLVPTTRIFIEDPPGEFVANLPGIQLRKQ